MPKLPNALPNHLPPPEPWRYAIGTRAAWQRGPADYRVSCTTCGAGGTVRYPSKSLALTAAMRDSAKACGACGAH